MRRPRRRSRALVPLDVSRVRTVPLARRQSLVAAPSMGRPVRAGMTVRGLFARLPDILAARDLRGAVERIARALRRGRPVVLGMGAHPIKVGLGPVIVDLIERGTFGMARETGEFLNRATREGVAAGLGLGRAIGDAILRARLPFHRTSILAAAARADIPATAHVAIGTDIIHMHPSADGAAIGEGSLRDFHLLAGVVARLAGGVYLNLGSAVVLPEVFVKALNLARNVGHPVRDLTTIDMDFNRHYRPAVNVVGRPTRAGGRGIQLTGHHEIMFPLLWAAVEDALARRR